MVNVDRWTFRLDIAFVPIGGVFLYDVLLGVDFTEPIGLEAGVYGLAVITCAVATAASLLLVRPRLTDWEARETELRMLRVLLPLGWMSSLQLVGLPNRGPLGQHPVALLYTIIAILVIAMTLLFCYICLATPADETAHVTAGS